MKSQPRHPVFVCVLHPNGQGKIAQFSKSICGVPQVLACFVPGRDSKGFKLGKSGASLECSFMSLGLSGHGGSGASFVDPSLMEQRGLLGACFLACSHEAKGRQHHAKKERGNATPPQGGGDRAAPPNRRGEKSTTTQRRRKPSSTTQLRRGKKQLHPKEREEGNTT